MFVLGGKKKGGHVDISAEEINEVVNGDRLLQEMQAAVAQLKEDFVKTVAVRTNVGKKDLLN